MPLRPRLFLGAGVIAALCLSAPTWIKPAAGRSLVAHASIPPPAPSSRPSPSRDHASPAPTAAHTDAELAALLRSARFDLLLSRALTLTDPEARSRWLAAYAALAPAPLLAGHALGLPPGAERDVLLDQALERWVLVDPVAVAEWAAKLDDTPAHTPVLDLVLGRLVEHTDTLHRPTSAALTWAGLIDQPALRLRALRAVLTEWAATDAEAALRFAETSPALSAEERLALLDALTSPLPPDDAET